MDLAALTRWMQLHLASITGTPSEDIGFAEPLRAFDLDSVDSVVMALEMEKRFGLPVHPETFLEQEQTIEGVASALLGVEAHSYA